jgi:hypothetical protein
MPIGSIWRVKAFASRLRPHEIDALLTNQERRNIINLNLRKQTASGRLQIGTPAGFRSEQVAGFVLECMAGFVGIRTFFPEVLEHEAVAELFLPLK